MAEEDVEEIFAEHLSKNTVFKNRDALSPHYVPENLPYREEQVQELSKTVAPILSGRKPENVFIYGKTGTGKTVVTKYVLRKLREFAERKGIPVRTVYINCRIHNTRSRVFIKIGTELMPGENFQGLSTAYIYERILSVIRERDLRLIIVLDEIDKLKGISETVYALNRANDELERGSISLIGISNVLTLKDSLDPRTKSTLCQHEMIFPPYNAEGLRRILEDRAKEGFREGAISPGAIALTAAYAARQSGDARYALQLLLRAGDVADEESASVVTEEHVEKAKERVEEDIILEMIEALPEQEQILLLAVAKLTLTRKGQTTFGSDDVVLTSGEVYEAYARLAKELGREPVSDRWFREYISELSMYGLLNVVQAGKGFRGNTRIIRLLFSPGKIVSVLEKTLMA
ncbi:MAG: archaeal cell division control protein 6 [Candidatus Diapherotrites archaeon]|nr:archaeal cell division control protein 6 [Candidatus Diapherotrites archaeon]